MAAFQQEVLEEYNHAVKLGQKNQRECTAQGLPNAPAVLDDIVTDNDISGQVELGVIEVPTELIVGTKTKGRIVSFSSNFMPLLPDDTEFAYKWINLCKAHLSDTGIQDPIRCFEYLGKFYVQEGNKRVSVMRYYGAPTIPGHVTRVIPKLTSDNKIQRYYEFLKDYQFTKLYTVIFSQAGGFKKLQKMLGFEIDHVWTEDDRRYFNSRFIEFHNAYTKCGGDALACTPMDALLVWSNVYSFADLLKTSQSDIIKGLKAVWQDIKQIGRSDAFSVTTESAAEPVEKSLWGKIKSSVLPSHLNVAFINELSEDVSTWTQAHERGRIYLQNTLGDDLVTVQEYTGVGNGADAEAAMIDAINNGADVIFATTMSLIGVCRKIAAKYPHVKMLNCSISMPFTGVRTYYSRIYEGKFISGAIAGAMSKSNEIGYIASYPIFGVPAGINAFALGVQMTNPNARVRLDWSCIAGDHIQEMANDGIDFISTLDIPTPGYDDGKFGALQVQPDGTTKTLASPYWDWGTFYVKLVQSMLDGGWDTLNSSKNGEQAVNYWWGFSSGVIGLELSKDLPEGVRSLAKILRTGIANGTISPFHRRIVSQDGTVKNDGGQYFSMEQILNMDWLCENVDGRLPKYEELTEKGKSIVRVQGIDRDKIAEEEEDMLL